MTIHSLAQLKNTLGGFMLTNLLDIYSYPFMTRALIAGLAISICAALLGTNLVLRKQSMISDGLSHVAFGATIIALALGFAPLELTIPIVIVASYLILQINNRRNINADAAIAVLSASALAIGIIINSITKGINIDINSYLFGSILAISTHDLVITVIATAIILLLYVIFYRQIFAITLDELFAKAIGIKTKLYNAILAALCSIIIVLGMRMLGALLISILTIFPCLSAIRLTHSFKATAIISVILSISCFIFGLTASYIYNLPTGASIVVANLVCFTLCTIYHKIK